MDLPILEESRLGFDKIRLNKCTRKKFFSSQTSKNFRCLLENEFDIGEISR